MSSIMIAMIWSKGVSGGKVHVFSGSYSHLPFLSKRDIPTRISLSVQSMVYAAPVLANSFQLRAPVVVKTGSFRCCISSCVDAGKRGCPANSAVPTAVNNSSAFSSAVVQAQHPQKSPTQTVLAQAHRLCRAIRRYQQLSSLPPNPIMAHRLISL